MAAIQITQECGKVLPTGCRKSGKASGIVYVEVSDQ
jgi:hypothetical protein